MKPNLNIATLVIIAIALAVCLVSPVLGRDAPAPGAPVCVGGFCSAPQAARPQRYTGHRQPVRRAGRIIGRILPWRR